MAKGCVRAWDEEQRRASVGATWSRHRRALFRRDFTTPLRMAASDDGDLIRDLGWGQAVELLDWPCDGEWTSVRSGTDVGFSKTEHLVEIAYVNRGDGDNPCLAKLTLDSGETRDLLWGDYLNVVERGPNTCRVRARGSMGTLASDRLMSEALLEVYFIDVGQGDGVLVRTPDGRHMLVDGGLPRSNQMTGKNAADFVDWKFFFDYGDYRIDIDAVVASHSDYDHYGGLWDLVRQDDTEEDPELDALEVRVDTFYHPGLSRWKKGDANPFPHKDGLGPNDDGWFVRLLGDRADTDAALLGAGTEELGGDWKNFISDMVQRNPQLRVQRLGVPGELLAGGGVLPDMWPPAGGCAFRVLAPVTVDRNGSAALKDLGDTGENTNGHSICLRLDYGNARILLTGDLNKNSMDWLSESYGDRMAAFKCDVAKACHHGSHDISYRFLEAIEAGATVISSGDNEGFAHPRPEIVAASATTGYLSVDRARDMLLTPLVYMTEIERSTSVGEITHIAFSRYPVDAQGTRDGALFAQPFDGISDVAFPTASDRRAEQEATSKAAAATIRKDAVNREKARLQPIAEASDKNWTRAHYHYREVRGPFGIRYDNRSIWRSRLMTKVHYGLVNVRTDGEKIVCATIRETGDSWTVHEFDARF